MKKKNYTRRKFISVLSAGSAALALPLTAAAGQQRNWSAAKLAISGGAPVRTQPWPQWPAMIVDDAMLANITATTKSGAWSRINNPVNGTVASFEKKYAALTGAKYCVGTGSGTQALGVCVDALGIQPGDEVITSPYTDFGTISSILSARALPILADLDYKSYQIDAAAIEKKISPNTKAIMPVHIMGSACNMDAIMAVANKKNIPVIEDACQANFAKYKGQQLGTIGKLGCFSFQGSKQIAAGEGGAVIGNDDVLMDRVYTIQNHGTNKKGQNITIGQKMRMNEFEGSILLSQLEHAVERFEKRNENARYLSSKIKNIPGLTPQLQYEGSNSSGYYLYSFTYDKKHFNNADRALFLKALGAEGIPAGGYIKGMQHDLWTDHILQLDTYKKNYSKQQLQFFKDSLQLPNCDKVSDTVIVISGGAILLGSKADMDDIINALEKIYTNRNNLS
ncbi:DegT/DnrJ/EryC1/StrS family aminotransferase [Niabella soli]|uniref:Glutamine--scyllo-inositol aminotransferase n=1 Tax=Niabella soli DSM 19437 TaxID=929713 RepID=W0EZG5_9BACT|nr:DegT/DnrJ/EryC1/StrS family aminotransferase [Niabella soli]AHF14496.1 glutamine--scyllo-inositol aminotransferase [Niabella soli DSM 19437]